MDDRYFTDQLQNKGANITSYLFNRFERHDMSDFEFDIINRDINQLNQRFNQLAALWLQDTTNFLVLLDITRVFYGIINSNVNVDFAIVYRIAEEILRMILVEGLDKYLDIILIFAYKYDEITNLLMQNNFIEILRRNCDSSNAEITRGIFMFSTYITKITQYQQEYLQYFPIVTLIDYLLMLPSNQKEILCVLINLSKSKLAYSDYKAIIEYCTSIHTQAAINQHILWLFHFSYLNQKKIVDTNNINIPHTFCQLIQEIIRDFNQCQYQKLVEIAYIVLADLLHSRVFPCELLDLSIILHFNENDIRILKIAMHSIQELILNYEIDGLYTQYFEFVTRIYEYTTFEMKIEILKTLCLFLTNKVNRLGDELFQTGILQVFFLGYELSDDLDILIMMVNATAVILMKYPDKCQSIDFRMLVERCVVTIIQSFEDNGDKWAKADVDAANIIISFNSVGII